MSDIEAPAETGNGEDLRATISAAFEAAKAQDDEDFADSDPIDEGDSPAPKAERARDENGRFVAAEKSAQPVSDQATEKEAPEVPEVAPIEAPRSWPAEKKALFAQLPRESQEWILERESQVEKGFTQKSQLAARYEKQWQPVERELEQYQHYFDHHGITPGEAIQRLFRAQAEMDADPAQAIRRIAQSYNLNLAEVAAGKVSEAPQSHQPHIPELQEFRRFMAEQKERQTQEHVRGLESEVRSFSQAKDQAGNLLYPHVERLTDAMAPFVQLYRATKPEWSHQEVLAAAYKHALHDSPEVAAEEAKKAEAAKIADAKAKAVAAKRAGASIRGGSPGGGAVSAAPTNLRETIRAAMRGEI